MNDNLAQFRRELRNTQSQYYRLDQGLLTGRNADASQGSLDWKMRKLQRLARTEEVLDAFEASEKLYERWNRIERRYYGLY